MISNLEAKSLQQRTSISTMEKEASTLKQRIENLTARSEHLESQIQELEASDDIDSTQIQDRLRAENAELREQVDDLQMQLRDRDDDIDLMTEEASKLNAELDDLKMSSSTQSDTIEQVHQQLEQVREQLRSTHSQLQAGTDKIIFLEESRSRLQRELLDAKKLCDEREERSAALNTSLSNVRTMLAETQTSHKHELQAVKQAHDAEKHTMTTDLESLESQLSTQLDSQQRSLAEAHSVKAGLERDLVSCREKIRSMEQTIRRLGENEETINIDHARFRDALKSESDRHQAHEASLQQQLRTVEDLRNALRGDLDTKIVELRKTSEELKTIKAQTSSKDKQVQSAQAQASKLQGQLEEAEAKLQDYTSTRQLQATQVSSLEANITSLQDTLSAARREQQEQLLAKADEIFAASQHARDLTDKLHASEVKVSQAEAEKKRLALALSAADQRLLASSDKAIELAAEKEDLEARLERFSGQEDQTQAIESQQTKLRKELAAAKESIKSLQVEVDEIGAERDLLLEQLDEATASLEEQRTESAHAIQILRRDLQASQSALMRETERGNKLEADAAEEVKDATSKATFEQRRLTLKIQDLEESLSLAKQKHANLLANIGSTDTTSSALRETIKVKEEQIKELSEKCMKQAQNLEGNGVSEQMINELEDQLDEYESKLEETKRNHERAIKSLENEREALLVDLSSSKKKRESLIEDQRQLERELNDHRDTIEELSKQIRSAKPNSRDSHATDHTLRERDDLKRQLQNAKREIETFKSTAKSLESASSRDRQAEARLADQVRDATRKLKTLESELQQREKRINDLKAYSKEKTESYAALERRYKTLHSQSQNNKHLTTSRANADERAGLTRMMKYLRTKTSREESFRADLTYIKHYYDKQITSFEACNQANLAIIRQIGIYVDPSSIQPRTLKSVAMTVLATIRMARLAVKYRAHRLEREKLEQAISSR